MSGFYPDGVTQSSFDQFWSEKLDSKDTCSNCGSILLPDGTCLRCDEAEDEDEDDDEY